MVQTICFSEPSDGKSIAFPKRDEKIENSEQFELHNLENFPANFILKVVITHQITTPAKNQHCLHLLMQIAVKDGTIQ